MRRTTAKTNPHRQLGKLVEADRVAKNMSIREYALAAGIKDHTLVLRLERGKDVRLSAYLKLALAHGLKVPQEVKA